MEEYEDILLVLSVVFGFQPPLDNDTDIVRTVQQLRRNFRVTHLPSFSQSPNVPRLDLVLVPSIPTKLDQLRELLDTIERVRHCSEKISSLFSYCVTSDKGLCE